MTTGTESHHATGVLSPGRAEPPDASGRGWGSVLRRAVASDIPRHILLALGAVVMLAPFAWMVFSSFKPDDEIYGSNLLPQHPTFDAYQRVFDTVPMGRFFLNSVAVTGLIFLGQVLLAVPAAYALACMRFRGSKLALGLVLFATMLPMQVVAVPLYLLFAKAGLLDNRLSLISPFLASAFGVFLLRQFFLGIPQNVLDAARLDGASNWTTVWRIVLPMARPALTAFAVFSIVSHWNDYFWPSLVLSSDDAATVPYGISAFANSESNDFAAQMAAATLAVLPLVVGFLLAQRHFVRGLVLSNTPD
ncbi:carbohydrate ABC transporter permease [Streptomyces sp. NPDC004752]